jgi:hypothetical protein
MAMEKLIAPELGNVVKEITTRKDKLGTVKDDEEES